MEINNLLIAKQLLWNMIKETEKENMDYYTRKLFEAHGLVKDVLKDYNRPKVQGGTNGG